MKNFILIIFIFLLICIYQLIDVSNSQQTEIIQLKKEVKDDQWYKERVNYYLQVNIRQQEILNNFPQARKALQTDSTLQELNLHIQ